jgi:hypothetical protein
MAHPKQRPYVEQTFDNLSPDFFRGPGTARAGAMRSQQ